MYKYYNQKIKIGHYKRNEEQLLEKLKIKIRDSKPKFNQKKGVKEIFQKAEVEKYGEKRQKIRESIQDI